MLESSHARDSKILLDSGFYAVDSEFLELDSGLCLPDSSHWWESRFLELYSGFPKENVLRFLIPQQAKIPRIPQSGFLKWSDWYKYNQSLKKTHTQQQQQQQQQEQQQQQKQQKKLISKK